MGTGLHIAPESVTAHLQTDGGVREIAIRKAAFASYVRHARVGYRYKDHLRPDTKCYGEKGISEGFD